MSPAKTQRTAHTNKVMLRRTKVLRAINRLSNSDLTNLSRNEILTRCGEIMLLNSEFCGGWVGRYDPDEKQLVPLVFFLPLPRPGGSKELFRKQVLLEEPIVAPARLAIEKRRRRILKDIDPPLHIPLLPGEISFHSAGCWPLAHLDQVYGTITVYSSEQNGFPKSELDFLDGTVTDLSLALYAHNVSLLLQYERDFSTEIIDSIQALMVSVTPCGKILRFNTEAERISGYQQQEVLDRYWVDVLLSPENRIHYQNLFSDLLKSDRRNLSFRAPLLTKDGTLRTIDWHSSIKPDIDRGTVGMVLFGLDITDRLTADRLYDSAVAKWENIFTTIQDPALIVSRDGSILDANHATFSASRKSREEVIGQSVCIILHGGHKRESICPLETIIKSGKSRILHTELSGLHGDYLLTISPCPNTSVNEEMTLLVARDMTEEERHRAEAIRAAQLASLGELAAGVAHEINNPINGILNYAQMLRDLSLDELGEKIAGRIIDQSKRIASIVKNLLDFSRPKVEEPEPVNCRELLHTCIELVKHQLYQDDIQVEFEFDDSLPLIYCNASQVQQVLLNIISNSKYALNERYPAAHQNKKIIFQGTMTRHGRTPYVRTTITDFGSGIEHRLIERVFEPFFSTKPDGQGTGLGLSISYGLIRDNGGYLRIKSRYGSHTSVQVDLPVVTGEGGTL
ncbi:MAG: PAS domain S-box protein [Desulfofustis sp.]|nr:PAS domain S-box protein [Desulfofustis sp.]